MEPQEVLVILEEELDDTEWKSITDGEYRKHLARERWKARLELARVAQLVRIADALEAMASEPKIVGISSSADFQAT